MNRGSAMVDFLYLFSDGFGYTYIGVYMSFTWEVGRKHLMGVEPVLM